jgi:preprotein translocase subunit SecE
LGQIRSEGNGSVWDELFPSTMAGSVNLSQTAREDNLMAKLNPFEFIQEVRQEVSKVTWPTWKEVWITTLMVLIMVSVASVFFLVVDQILGHIVNFVLRLGS